MVLISNIEDHNCKNAHASCQKPCSSTQLSSPGVSNKDIYGPNLPLPQLSNYQKMHMQAYVNLCDMSYLTRC